MGPMVMSLVTVDLVGSLKNKQTNRNKQVVQFTDTVAAEINVL